MQRFPRYSRRAVITTAALAALPCPPVSARATGPHHTATSDVVHLVIDRDFPDPGVVDIAGVRWAYATNSGGTNVQVATAEDLTGPWRHQPDALPSSNLPEWIGPDAQGHPNIWAPDVSRRDDGTFLLYYTAFHSGNRQQCLGAAVADTPGGPFAPTGPQPLVCGAGRGDVIDPAAFVDSDGRRYLLYKDSRGARARGGPSAIRLRPVAADGLTQQGSEVVLLRSTRPEEAGVIEAPTLVRREQGYVLFYSANTFDSGRYFTNYATSPTLTGPYTKAPGAFLSKDTLDGQVADPGGQDVVEDSEHIVFHGDLAAPGGPRGMYVAGLRWNGLHPVLAR